VRILVGDRDTDELGGSAPVRISTRRARIRRTQQLAITDVASGVAIAAGT
jgi:hypothetical protein